MGMVRDVSGPVFISYCREADADYVERLAAYLVGAGVAVWHERPGVTGPPWSEIEQHIAGCAAFIVVMTGAARKSAVVNREVDHAELLRRPVFPLLLAGERFFRLAHVRHDNVVGGRMPSADFVDRLTGVAPVAAVPPLAA
jgi:hypothetical protein